VCGCEMDSVSASDLCPCASESVMQPYPQIGMRPRGVNCAIWSILLLWLAAGASGSVEKPGPFTFVYGLDKGGTLADLQTFGVNTLYIDLRADELADLKPVAQQIREASAAGYKVIVGIPTTSFANYRISPYSEQYLEAVSRLITTTVNGLRDEPGISAWATGHYLEKNISDHDGDFREFLSARYGDLDSMNRYWDASFRIWADVKQDAALSPRYEQPFGFGRAAVDVADYRQYAFGEVMRQWAETIKSLDSSRPLLTGSVALYRSIAAVPDLYDIIVVSMPPDVMRTDRLHYGDHITHNVQAVDMARRGGRFDVLPVLRMPLAGEPGYAGGLRDWILEADMHGACGVGIENWERYSQFPQITYWTLRSLQEAWPRADFSGHPQPTAAILYSHYAEGFQVSGQPVYGHLKWFGIGEPSNLMEGLRTGTCFGLVDCLTTADLAEVDLQRYSVIIVPAGLGVTEADGRILAEYVKSGGALMADVGLGLHCTGSWLRLPSPLQNVFGIRELSAGEAKAGDLTVSAQVPELPSLRVRMKSSGSFRASLSSSGSAETYGARAYSISSYAAYAGLTQNAVALGVLDAKTVEEGNPLFSGLIYNTYGRGIAMFATHLLYSYWSLSDPMSSALHYDLMSRRASCKLLDSPFLPQAVEVSLEGDRFRVLNGSATDMAYNIGFHGQGDRLVEGVLTINRAERTAGGERQTVQVTVPAHSIRSLSLSRITAQPYEAEVSMVIRELRPDRIHMVAAGPGAKLAPTRKNPYHFRRPESAVRVRFGVAQGGVYAVGDGSRHLVSIQPERGKARRLEVVARNGALSFTEEVYRDEIIITPAR